MSIKVSHISMQQQTHGFISKHPDRYFPLPGILNKAVREERNELVQAIANLDKVQRKLICLDATFGLGRQFRRIGRDKIVHPENYPQGRLENTAEQDIYMANILLGNNAGQWKDMKEVMEKEIAKLIYKIEREIGDIEFALCCLCNTLIINLEASYRLALKTYKANHGTLGEKFKFTFTSCNVTIPLEGWSKPENLQYSPIPYKVLLHNLDAHLKEVEDQALLFEKYLHPDIVGPCPDREKTKTALMLALGYTIIDLVRFSHKYGVDGETSFVKTMDNNHLRELNDYQKEKEG